MQDKRCPTLADILSLRQTIRRNTMAEYTIWVNTPGKGQIIVKIVSNSDAAAMNAAKQMGGQGAYCGIMSRKYL